MEQYIDFEGRHLRHRLRGMHELVLAHFLRTMPVGDVQIDALHQLHVVQQGVEGYEIGKAHLATLGFTLHSLKLNLLYSLRDTVLSSLQTKKIPQ